MTATHTTASSLLVAIDMSTHRHEVLIGYPGKKRRRRLTNTLEDFQRMMDSKPSQKTVSSVRFHIPTPCHSHSQRRSAFPPNLLLGLDAANDRFEPK